MNRRKFFGQVGTLAAVAAFVPSTLSAINWRETKIKAFEAKKIDNAMNELFGTSSTTEGNVKLKAPDIAENGAVIPVSLESDLKATRIAVFQDANPETLVAVFDVPQGGIIDYSIRIKMMKTGKIKVVAEVDGKLYSAEKEVKVTIGGCGG